MTKVEPALTPEEWADWIDSGDLQAPLEAHGEVSHALAALGLYGQPFGFTRGDVTVLRDMVYFGRKNGYTVDEDGLVLMASLADRIAALLPPDEGNPT